MRKNLFFIAIAVLAVSGCVKQEFLRDSFLELSAVSKPVLPVGGSPATRVKLPTGTVIGVYAPSAEEDITSAAYSNVPYTAEADGSLTGEQIVLGMNKDYNLYAYAPRREVIHNPHAVEFFHGEDVLWATYPLVNIPAGIVSAVLEFEHKMTQVSFDVQYADETTPDERATHPIEGATIVVTGFYDNCFLDIATGTITLGTSGNTTVTQKNTPINIITPANGNLSLRISVTIPSTDDSPAIEFSGNIVQTFNANTSYVVRIINIEKTAVLISATVVAWLNGGSETVIVD